VGLTLTVQSLVLVELKTTSSADVGTVSDDQLAASFQLFVEPPPSHVRVAAHPSVDHTVQNTSAATSASVLKLNFDAAH
jgi:hypothetical protein